MGRIKGSSNLRPLGIELNTSLSIDERIELLARLIVKQMIADQDDDDKLLQRIVI